MGCCSGTGVSTPEIAAVDNEEILGKDGSLRRDLSIEKIQIQVIIPRLSEDQLIATAENSIDSSASASPTQGSQRSGRKSVTFNPISTIKEYCRDSSSADKDFTTYICQQLGFDTLSDTDSDEGIEEGDENEESEPDNYEPEYFDNYRQDAWLRYEEELARECEIDPNDPAYFEDYDIEYDPDTDYSFSHAHSYCEPSYMWACS